MFSKCVFLLALACLDTQAWYTCEQKPFCDKIRSQQDGSSPFVIDGDTIKISDDALEADILNTETNSRLKLTFYALEDNTFRLFVDDPKLPRYSPKIALDGEPAKVTFRNVRQTEENDEISIENGKSRAVLTTNPFKIEVFRENDLVTVVNGRKRFVFNSGDDLAIALDVSFPQAQRLYGIPEHAENLALKTTGPGVLDPYRLFNVDYAAYKVGSRESLYGAVPVLYAHNTKRTSGIFWLNSAQTFVDIDNGEDSCGALFISESGVVDLFIFTGPTLEASVQQYARLTGTAPLPQYFAIAFHQSRYSYMSQNDLETVVSEFDKHDFPLDVMWLDIDYTDQKKYFTWDNEQFPNPIGMQDYLNSTGRKLVVIIDPHFKVEKGYFLYDEATEKGYFVKNPDGSDFQGNCWPGTSSYLDFTNPDAKKYYASLFGYDSFPGTTQNTYIWNDMNEPSVFSIDEQTMPNDLVHHGGWLHRDLHNLYGFTQTIGTYEGLLARADNRLRPFILTRSHFAGSQRYTAMWTGDNVADWNYLKISVPMCLTEALAGISFCGADVGGFINNVEEELYQRWFQAGAWLPFFRAHSTNNVDRREPYLYSTEIQQKFRAAMRQRYVHLPFWYTLWWQHQQSAIPVIRPLTYHYSNDANTLDIDNQWLVGSNILVCPVMDRGIQELQVYLPGGTQELWYWIDTNQVFSGNGFTTIPVQLETVPVFYRGGSIVPRKDTPRPSSVHTHDDPYSLYIFLDGNSRASGALYVDDFESFDYKNKKYLYFEYTYENGVLSARKIDEDAEYDSKAKIDKIFIYGNKMDIKSAVLESNNVNLNISHESQLHVAINDVNIDVKKSFKIKIN